MKWFKHMSDSLDDPFIQSLIDEFGAHGYMMWFGLIEIICKENGHNLTGEITVSEAFLRRKLRTSSTKLHLFLTFCRGFAKVLVTFSDKNINIKMSKILEIKDNYTKDLQATGKKLSLEAEVEAEKEKEEERKRRKKKPPPPKNKKIVSKEVLEGMEKEFPNDDVPKCLQAFYDYIEIHGKKYKNYDLAFQARMRNEFSNIKKEGKDGLYADF